MNLHAQPLLRLAGAAADHDERRFLSVSARYGVQQVQATCTVRDDAHAKTVGDARGAVGGEPDGRFVAQRDEPEAPILLECFVEIQDEIARDPEDVPDALRVELVKENLVKLHCCGYLTVSLAGSRRRQRRRP
jgi:hypothetical protein